MTVSTIPKTMRAIVSEGGNTSVKSIPTPNVVPGSALVKVESFLADVVCGGIVKVPFFTHPDPMVVGTRCIGRIAATGSDATSLPIGQLVMVDSFLRARDNPDMQGLLGMYDGPTPQGRRWFADNWRNGTWAEYTCIPLENVYALNEAKLCGTFGYSISKLNMLPVSVVGYGGLRGIDLKAGETVIVSPATGHFSGSTVAAAVAMGAHVIAVSRNLDGLKKLQANLPRVDIVQYTGNAEADTAAIKKFGPIDAYLDISPGSASTSHIRSCIFAVRQYGRVSLMGTINDDIPIPYAYAMIMNLTIRGQYMYERVDVWSFIKLVESGLFNLNNPAVADLIETFKLDHHHKATEKLSHLKSPGLCIDIVP